jgi:hypothetical protein
MLVTVIEIGSLTTGIVVGAVQLDEVDVDDHVQAPVILVLHSQHQVLINERVDPHLFRLVTHPTMTNTYIARHANAARYPTMRKSKLGSRKCVMIHDQYRVYQR